MEKTVREEEMERETESKVQEGRKKDREGKQGGQQCEGQYLEV